MTLYHGSLEIKEVKQNNLYLLLPSKVCRVAKMMTADKEMTLINAIKSFYSSPVYQQLEQEHTKYWHLGPRALYEEAKQ